MSTTTLTFRLLLNGTPTDPDDSAVLLRDVAGVFGVKRADTGGIVVAAGTAMTRVSAGLYTYPVTDPATGLLYQWVAQFIAGGVMRNDPFTELGTAAATAAGFWWTQVKVERRWGVINTAVASAQDGQGGVDVPTIQTLGNDLDSEVDRELRGYGYARPDPAVSADYAVTSRIATDVLHWRLEGRRLDLKEGAKATVAENEAAAWAELDDMLRGSAGYDGRSLDFPLASGESALVTAPVGLRQTVDRDGRAVTASNAGWPRARWDPAWGGWRW